MNQDRREDLDPPRRGIVITGASTGIGAATTGVLIQAGYHVFSGVRRTEDAEALRQRYPTHCTPLLLDVTQEKSVQTALAQVGEWLGPRTLAALVNNAGIAKGGPLLYQSLGEFEAHFAVNVFGTLRITKAFAPLLGAESPHTRVGPPGRIVMISSVAGQIAAPFLGAYAASKHALEGLSDSLRREMIPHGVKVVVIAPGHVATPIWDKAESHDYHQYDHTEYSNAISRFRDLFLPQGKHGSPPERVGQVILQAIESAHPRIHYAVVHAPLRNWMFPKWLPHRLLDRYIAYKLGLRPMSPAPITNPESEPLPANPQSF